VLEHAQKIACALDFSAWVVWKMRRLVRILEGIALIIGFAGVTFLLLSLMMLVTGVGRNPYLVGLIGLALLAIGGFISSRITPKCPRCGSRLMDGGACQVCDYKAGGEG